MVMKNEVTTIKPTFTEEVEMILHEIRDLTRSTETEYFNPQLPKKRLRDLVRMLQDHGSRLIVGDRLVLPFIIK